MKTQFPSPKRLALALMAAAAPALGETPRLAELTAVDLRLEAAIGVQGGLTSDEVARLAVQTSPDLESQREQVASAAALVDAAMVGFFPRLSGKVAYTRLSVVDPYALPALTPATSPGPAGSGTTGARGYTVPRNSTELSSVASFGITDVILRASQQYAASSQSALAARFNEGATRLRIQSDAKVTYYGWVRARLQAEVADQAVSRAALHREDVRALFQADRVTRADVLAVESQLADAQLQAARTKNLVSFTEAQLRIVMHGGPPGPLAVGEGVQADLPPLSPPPTLAALSEQALSDRLELRSMAASTASLQAQASAARSASVPAVTLVAGMTLANPNSRYMPPEATFKSSWDWGVQATWSPNDALTGIFNGKSLDARARANDAQLRATQDSLRLEVADALQQVENADAAVVSTAQGLAAAEEGYRVRRLLFLAGRATSVELTDAETDLTRSRQASLDAHVDQRISRERLRHSTGQDVTAGTDR